MRALLLLLVVLLALFTLRWFGSRSAGPVEAGGGAERVSAPEAGTPKSDPAAPRFLAPPPGMVDAPEVRPPADPVAAPQRSGTGSSGNAQAAPAEASWPTPARERGGAEVVASAALVHGTPSDVQAAAASLPLERARLLEAFSWAVHGELQMARSLAEKLPREQVGEGEQGLFETALTGSEFLARPSSEDPVPLAMEMALLDSGARKALEGRRYPEAAEAFSWLLLAEISAPWTAGQERLHDWSQGLEQAQREYRWSPRGDWPGVEETVRPGDNLIKIRLRYLEARPEALMCTGLIERANRIRGYLQPGQVLRIPTDPVRMLVDLEARWALFLMGDQVAAAWPVGIGRPGEETPPGDYTVRNKIDNPPWMKEGQEPIPFGDPRNPLGTRWIGWSREGVKTSYGFHGTWEPDSVGQASSDGCVRFRNEDVEVLFQILPEGAPIRIQG